MGNGHLPAATCHLTRSVPMDYKKARNLGDFLAMEMRLARDAAAWKPDSGYWIMADFRDGKATMDAAAGSPGLASQEDRTKKGQNSADGQWTMEWRQRRFAGPAGYGEGTPMSMENGDGQWRMEKDGFQLRPGQEIQGE